MNRLYDARKYLGLTQKAVAEILQIGQNTYSMIENGKISLTDKNRGILAEKLRLNPLWLTQGIGPMFLDHRPDNAADQANRTTDPSADTASGKDVPFYADPFDPNGVSLNDQANSRPEYYVNYPPFNDCSFYRPVWGESMSPRYNPGDVIACKQVVNKNYILYGETYLCIISIDGDTYETLKILRKHNSDPSMIILRPANPDFDETTIPIDSILELYIIKGRIERNI